jgi:hypothetical protein
MPWARIDTGVVVELTQTDPTGLFNPALVWEPCAATVQIGWTYNGTTFAAPVPPPAPVLTLAQQAQALLAAGLTITSTSMPALNATYPTDPATQDHIQAEVNAILLQGTFADGSTSVVWPDVTGAAHTFPSVAEFKLFASAIAAFVAGNYKVLNGSSTMLPAATATIA